MRAYRHALLLLPLLTTTAFGQQPQSIETTPVSDIPSFECIVPQPPTAFCAGGRGALCYELYITNMRESPFWLKRVRAFGEANRVLLDWQGIELGRALVRIGQPGAAEERPAPIDPGQRVIFFAWAEWSPHDSPPKTIRHELTFEAARGGASFVIATAETPVLTSLRTIASPVRGENWFAGNGPSNTSAHRRVIVALGGVSRAPERFAIDYVQVGADGGTFTGDQNQNSSYHCYGQSAYAVADGVVSAFKDGIPENKPGDNSRAVTITKETIGGNHVILDIGGGQFAFYAHLQPGKIRVKLGDHVKVGDIIGLVGNSGNSTEPHLHFHISNRNSPLESEGLPYAMESFVLRGRADGLASPIVIDWLKTPSERNGEMPAENDIISVVR
jgi:hypothetical protein